VNKLTLKDFITYNNPCFNCGERISLSIYGHSLGGAKNNTYNQISLSNVKPIVTPEHTTIDLKISYRKTLSVCIYHISNKIVTTDVNSLSDYLKAHKIYLKSSCSKCHSVIESFFLDFDLDHGYLKPTSINRESLFFRDSLNTYSLVSDVYMDKTDIFVFGENYNNVSFQIPLMLLSKFKSKDRILKKIKTYLLFS